MYRLVALSVPTSHPSFESEHRGYFKKCSVRVQVAAVAIRHGRRAGGMRPAVVPFRARPQPGDHLPGSAHARSARELCKLGDTSPARGRLVSRTIEPHIKKRALECGLLIWLQNPCNGAANVNTAPGLTVDRMVMLRRGGGIEYAPALVGD